MEQSARFARGGVVTGRTHTSTTKDGQRKRRRTCSGGSAQVPWAAFARKRSVAGAFAPALTPLMFFSFEYQTVVWYITRSVPARHDRLPPTLKVQGAPAHVALTRTQGHPWFDPPLESPSFLPSPPGGCLAGHPCLLAGDSRRLPGAWANCPGSVQPHDFPWLWVWCVRRNTPAKPPPGSRIAGARFFRPMPR